MASEGDAYSLSSAKSCDRLSYSNTFPRQRKSSSSDSSSQSQQQHIVLALGKQLLPSTRFAFTDLIITILRLDFYKNSNDSQSIAFCNKALDILLKWGNLPIKTQNSLRMHIEEATAFNEDIAALITSIKADPFLEQHGCVLLLGSFLLSIIVDGDYDSRFRVLLRHASALLGVHWDVFEEFESSLSDQLVTEYKESLENQQIREKKSKLRKYKRFAIIGAATGLGGVLIGVTGGLAAPLIVASISALTATTIFAGLTGTAITAIFGSLFGVAGAGLSGYRMRKRVGDIEEFTIERLTEEENQALHCVLCVSGWIEDREPQAFRTPWRHLWMSKEQYTLRWESKYLEELGKSIEYFVSFAVSYAIQRSLMETVLAGLVSAIAWPLILLGSSSIIDNPWNICTKRAAEAGEHLAEVLLTRSHGRRPITLIGFSLGARVIYHCLMEMNKRKPDSLGIVEDVILLGAPVSASPSQWRQICSVVSGRVINGYCKTDWLLRFLYRLLIYLKENYVKGHLDYSKKLTKVLESVGARVAPLSSESKQDLERLEKLQNKLQNKKLLASASVPNMLKLDDESSIILEQSKGLVSNQNIINDDENYEEEDIGLRLKGDPLEILLELDVFLVKLLFYLNYIVYYSEKARKDLEHLEHPAIRAHLRQQRIYQNRYDKAKEIFDLALVKEEDSFKELATIKTEYTRLQRVANRHRDKCEKLENTHQRQEEIYCSVNGSSEYMELSQIKELEVAQEWLQRVTLAKFKWITGRSLLIHANIQINYAINSWQELPQTNGVRSRYFIASEARNNFVNSINNIQSCRVYLDDVQRRIRNFENIRYKRINESKNGFQRINNLQEKLRFRRYQLEKRQKEAKILSEQFSKQWKIAINYSSRNFK
ncbi:hypothetical protein Mgra_00001442 [Meloidogyne graminicola]|uniref:Uncharacterized protein n=1 Tax=Meloidogyne graminicola TaxID=189291 RepID=A0A8T0A108_9BILA|nr:hypothetical protein Mgra_00001442 [Meloidogyne graminicola]